MTTLFKKSLMSTALILMSTSAMAALAISASGTFEWYGTYNMDTYGTYDMDTPKQEFCINVSDMLGDGLDHNAGELVLVPGGPNKDKVDIKSSSELGFTVVARDNKGDCNGEPLPFAYTLTDYKVGITKADGFERPVLDKNELDDWRLIHRNHATGIPSVSPYDELDMNVGQKMPTGGDVGLKVKGLYLGGIEDGDAVRVRAFVLVDASDGATTE